MQTKNKTIDSICDFLESKNFNYDLTEEVGFNSIRKTDYFRSKDCRYMICKVNNTLSDDSPNLIIIDASIGELPYDTTIPTTKNCIFQGIVENEEEIKKVFDILKIK